MDNNKMSKINLGNGENKPYLMWEKHWLSEWSNLAVDDKKVLAALYWEDLTDTQKQEFTDSEYIDMQKLSQAKHAELISDPVRMKRHFLTGAAPLIDEMIELANGKKKNVTKITESELWAKREVWNVLKEVISKTNDLAPIMDLKGKSISDQIDQILTKVSQGQITIEEAKDYMQLVSSGFNLQELPKLLATLDKLESN